MPIALPPGAKQLALPQVMTTGGKGQIRDVSGNLWFSALQPPRPVAPAGTRVRQYGFPPGANFTWTPGSEDNGSNHFWVLREVADSWDMLRIVIETVKDRLCAEEGDFRLIQGEGENNKDLKARTASDPRIKNLISFFKYPDGVHSFNDWLKMWLEDVLVLDAAAVYLERDKKGMVCSVPVIDGGTINRCITDQGFTPTDPDSVAFQQVLYGLPAINLTVDDLIYTMRNPRTWRRYGFGPVEQMLTTISIGLNKQQYDLKYFTEGNVPEALCFLPPDMPLDNVKETQDWFDSMLAGNLGRRRRLTFLPGYGSPRDQAFRPNIVFTKENALKNPMDEWLFQVICYGLGTSPGAMLKMMNRATAQQSNESAEEEGLEPKLRTIEQMMNNIIQLRFGYDDIEYKYGQRRELDAEKQMTVDTGYIKVGARTLNEVRIDSGQDPYDTTKYPEADEPIIITAQGVMTLRDALNMGTAQAQQTQSQAAAEPKNVQEAATLAVAGRPPMPTQPSNGKPKGAKKVLETSGDEVPRISPSYTTPTLRRAQEVIATEVKNVFRRQKERALQSIKEMKKFNENHGPDGKFSSGPVSGFGPDEQTIDRYSDGKGNWTPERAVWQQSIIDQRIGDRVPTGKQPVLTVMGGGVATGKSTVRGQCVPPGSDPVVADPDAIKAAIPEYEALKQDYPDRASTLVHEESSVINKKLIAQAMKKKLDILYDGSFSNGTSADSLIKASHDNGYKVNVVYADVPTEMAMQRAADRAKFSMNPADRGRVVPEHDQVINGQLVEGARTRHRMAAANFFRLRDKGTVDSLRAYDTSGEIGTPPKLFYSKEGNNPEVIHDPARFEQYRKKSQGIE